MKLLVCSFLLALLVVNCPASSAMPLKWSGIGKFLTIQQEPGPENREVIKIENTNATSSAMSNAMLDAKTLQGKRLTVTALIRAEDVAEPAKSYLGVKLMIVVVRSDGSVKYFENLPAHCRFGTYSWKAAKVSAAIPADAERVFLSIGLQQTSGVVYYSGFRSEVQP